VEVVSIIYQFRTEARSSAANRTVSYRLSDEHHTWFCSHCSWTYQLALSDAFGIIEQLVYKRFDEHACGRSDPRDLS
jgi:hypothetical protein